MVWFGLVLGATPVLGWLFLWWNEIWYAIPVKRRSSSSSSPSTKLPPGHMGLPFFGEMLTFLWYFKFLKRPDDFINAKRSKYGDGVGLYRTHLFGSPSIIACFPSVNKFVLKNEEKFTVDWPNIEIVGRNSLAGVTGQSHTRLRNFISNAINRPDALRRIAVLVQPRMAVALQSWAHKAHIIAFDEVKKLTFENIGKLFASLEAGPLLHTMDKLFEGMLLGVRAQPINFPGTAYYHALQCRKRLEKLFRIELERKKKKRKENKVETIDLMDGMMDIEDEEGNKLSEEEVIDNIIGFVIAGYGTVSLASTWAIYYLAKCPLVLRKLRDENMIIRKTTKGDFITSEDVSRMSYTNKVVEEAIRMANVAPFIFRSATEDVDYKGYIIPKGWNVFVWVRYLHTCPDNFEDPMCFNPDRWNEPRKPEAYQVFGGGRRICAGNMLARMQLALLLHHLSTGYKWELINPNAGTIYLSHAKPADGVEIAFSKI